MKLLKHSIHILLVSGLLVAPHAWSADCSKPEKSEGEMSEATYADVQSAMEMLSKNKTAEAIEKLSKMADKGSEYEKALVNYNLGIAYSSKNDYPNATKAFAKSLT